VNAWDHCGIPPRSTNIFVATDERPWDGLRETNHSQQINGILIVVGYFSRYLFAHATTKITGEAVVESLEKIGKYLDGPWHYTSTIQVIS